MILLVCSDDKKVAELFSSVKRSKDFKISFAPVSDIKKILKDPLAGTLIYLDITAGGRAVLTRTVKMMSTSNSIYFGIIDPKGLVSDVAELFHLGAVDYIGKEQFKEKNQLKRVKRALEFIKTKPVDESKVPKKPGKFNDYIYSGNDWKGIKSGKEYSFCFMFIEFDGIKEEKDKISARQFNELIGAFQEDLNEIISDINGRIWMWMDSVGLILLPFDGKKCDAILTCFKMMMNKNIFSFENYTYDRLLSFRIVLHIGNTEYKVRGDTGSIVSDSINSIFHLGQKFAKPGNMYITENMFEFVPDWLGKYFKDEGVYEGRLIKRMTRLM